MIRRFICDRGNNEAANNRKIKEKQERMSEMKKNLRTKAILATVLMLVCALLLSTALAGTSTESGRVHVNGSSDLQLRLNTLNPFKFWKHKNGIGYGRCPVYTAPSEDAYRCADGKALCDTNYAMDEAGFVSGWLLVRYPISNGQYRVGYIPPRYVKGFKSSMAPHFDYIPAVADEEIFISDNPMIHGTSFAMLEEGEQFYILSRYNYNAKNGFDWWYIQCEVDGQLACGFIEVDGTDFHLGESDITGK